MNVYPTWNPAREGRVKMSSVRICWWYVRQWIFWKCRNGCTSLFFPTSSSCINVPVPSFIPISSFHHQLAELKERERRKVRFKTTASWCASWNLKASTPFSQWCLACKTMGIAEENRATLHWQRTRWNNFTASFSYYSANWEINRN